MGFFIKMIQLKSYTVQYKLNVLSYVDANTPTAASKPFHINPSMISRSRKQLPALVEANSLCCRVGDSGRPVSHPHAEQSLYNWISIEREHLYPVTYLDIKGKMIEFSGDGFKASTGWFRGFLSRFDLSVRQITNHFRAPYKPHNSATNMHDKIQLFRKFLRESNELHQFKRVINVDQTPVWLKFAKTAVARSTFRLMRLLCDIVSWCGEVAGRKTS